LTNQYPVWTPPPTPGEPGGPPLTNQYPVWRPPVGGPATGPGQVPTAPGQVPTSPPPPLAGPSSEIGHIGDPSLQPPLINPSTGEPTGLGAQSLAQPGIVPTMALAARGMDPYGSALDSLRRLGISEDDLQEAYRSHLYG
jgi:hypothetical protein